MLTKVHIFIIGRVNKVSWFVFKPGQNYTFICVLSVRTHNPTRIIGLYEWSQQVYNSVKQTMFTLDNKNEFTRYSPWLLITTVK